MLGRIIPHLGHPALAIHRADQSPDDHTHQSDALLKADLGA
jgi:hypothetical protein